jgi:hypothetical protein
MRNTRVQHTKFPNMFPAILNIPLALKFTGQAHVLPQSQ